MTKQTKSSKITSRGVGPSKRFNGPPEAQREPYQHIQGCHMGGRPVEDVVPISSAHLITYDHTDEGIAARNEGKADSAARVRAASGDRSPVTGASREHKLSERRDHMQVGMEPWEAPDPMKELVEKHIGKGMRPRFLSPFKIQKQGKRGFEIVKDEKGDPVTLGELVLAQMPEEQAERRNRVFREKDLARRRELENRNEKLVRVDSAESLRPIVHDVAEPQGDLGLHSDWAE